MYLDMAGDRKHFLEGKTIIVAGGGIAGSAFTVALRKLWDPALQPPTVTILERDHENIARQREGYSLSLSGQDSTGGLDALRKLGLLDDVLGKAVSGVEGKGAFKIWGADWTEKISFKRKPMPGLPTASIRIARKELRQSLHDATTSATTNTCVQWETQCIAAKPAANGRVRVTVQTGSDGAQREEECDLLLVADGASSKLRASLRPDDKLEYAGAVLRGGLARFEEAMPKGLDEDWGFQLSGDGVSCFYSPVDAKSVVWALGHMEDQLSSTDVSCEKSARQVMERGRQLGRRFHEPFNAIVDHTDLTTVMCINAKDKMPFAHDNLDKLPVVFIGDSNHALSPFAGYGANLALNDGWDLAEQLCGRTSSSLTQAVKAYDSISVPRATRIVKGARRKLRTGHSTGFRLWVFCLMLAVGKLVGMVLGR